jgi:hypothetical protein
MRFSICATLAIIFVAGSCKCQQTAMSPPKLYVSKGACPFECCTYQKWTANRTVRLMDHPGGQPLAQIQKGHSVLGITGDIYTSPLPLRVERGGSGAKSVPAGSTVYLLHPLGEGLWLAWVRGKTIQIDPDYKGRGPQYLWWAKVRIQSGKTGWGSYER